MFKLDNFALSNHQACPAKYDLRIRKGWQVRSKSAALGFGGAIHAGLADRYRGGSLHSSLSAIHSAWPVSHPVDDYRDLNKALRVMEEYADEYPRETFDVVGFPEVPMIEIPFSIQLTQDDGTPVLTDGGQEIFYGGIFDGLVEWTGQVYVFEHKSTSQLGDYYFDQFKPNNQITGYVWAATQLTGRPVAGAVINAIGVYKVGKTKFKRQITSRSADDLRAWVTNIQASASEIEWHEKRGYWPQRNVSCTQFGRCEFHQVHVLANPHDQQRRLETDYVIEHWDYERRDGNA